MEKKKIYNNINLIKLLMVIAIINYHLICHKIGVIYNSVDFYSHWGRKIGFTGSDCVFCLFLISGVFLYKTLNKPNLLSFREFFINKILRLWPILAFSTLMCTILPYIFIQFNNALPPIQSMILNLFFIHNMNGIAMEASWNAVSWYVCALFWASILFYFLRRFIKDNMKMNVVVFLIIIISLMVFSGYGYNNCGLFLNVFPVKWFGTIAAIGMGYLLGQVIFTCHDDRKISPIQNLFLGFVECSLFAIIFLPLFFSSKEIKEPMLYYLALCLLIFLFVQCNGWFSKALNSDFFAKISAPSYSIYLMQEACFIVLQGTFWTTQFPVTHPKIALFLSFMFCIIIGVLTYLVIEKPIEKFIKKRITDK